MYLTDIFTIPVNLAGLPGDLGARRLHRRRPADRPAAHRARVRRSHAAARRRAPTSASPTGTRAARALDATVRSNEAHDEPTRPSSASRCTPSSSRAPRCSAAARRRSAPRRTPRPARSASGCPASLPVLNRRAVELGMRTALALGCAVNAHNRFARKNYFYPDLPKNYQISQYEEPLAEHGTPRDRGRRRARARSASSASTSRRTPASSSTRARSRRRGRAWSTSTAPACRCSRSCREPDLRSPDGGRRPTCASSARSLRYLEVCDGNMEEGSLRCDANVSVRPRRRRPSSAPRSRSRT